MERIKVGGLNVSKTLHDFVRDEALAGKGIAADAFWSGLAAIVRDLAPRNRELLATRDRLQEKIDAYLVSRKGQPDDAKGYQDFLREIGYLRPEPADFSIATENVDDEIARIAGPQLVVPVSNARYALNAANARWGSLYDALYGTDAIADEGDARRNAGYNKERGGRVVARVRAFLDEAAPLAQGSHADAASYAVEGNALAVTLRDTTKTGLARPEQFAGLRGTADAPGAILLRNHGLHVEIVIDRESVIGKDDPAGVSDVVLESAISTIMDLEDSVAAVDAEDKVVVYRNWLGLMDGTLAESFEKDGRLIDRRLNADRVFSAPSGGEVTLHGRSLMLVRNVGHHMYTDAVLDEAGQEIPEGILDAAVTSLDRARRSAWRAAAPQQPQRIDLHREAQDARPGRSRARERIVRRTRTARSAAQHDKDRHYGRGAAHHVESQGSHPAANERVFFINTGFLDRTGDEIHTSIEAGPMVRKNDMKNTDWIAAYENANVDVGIACGLPGRRRSARACGPRRTGWPICSRRRSCIRFGANTAWVPSPTAAVLHAVHYHKVDVATRWKELARRSPPHLSDLLAIPVGRSNWPPDDNSGRARQQLRRGFSAMSCVGSTRASAVPRCRISMTSVSWRIAPRCEFRASTSPIGCITGSSRGSRS